MPMSELISIQLVKGQVYQIQEGPEVREGISLSSSLVPRLVEGRWINDAKFRITSPDGTSYSRMVGVEELLIPDLTLVRGTNAHKGFEHPFVQE